jgi:hypothetical protein
MAKLVFGMNQNELGLVPFSSRRATRRFIAKDLPVPGPAVAISSSRYAITSLNE